MSTRLIQDLHAGISRRDWSAVEVAANRLRDEIDETRRILAGTGIGSLPNDYPLPRLAADALDRNTMPTEAMVDWDNPNDPVVKLFVGYDVESYVEEYELCGEGGDYSPNEQEKTILVDAIYGVVSDLHEKLRALSAALAHPGQVREIAIKPLTWKYDSFQSMWSADSVIGDYIAWCISGNSYFSFHPTANSPTKAGSNEDEAKAAAQADYERRIRSALALPLPVQESGDIDKPVICIGRHTINQLMAGESVEIDAAIMIPASDLSEPNVEGSPLLEWAIDQWKRQVANRPLVNIHRRSLDDVWRQVIRWAGGDPGKLIGPAHDELLAMEGQRS